MSNFNLNNNDDAFSNEDNNEEIKPRKRERLPERTTGQIMNDLNIERDCIFNADRFENNMCEIGGKFGAEIGVKFAYEVDVIEEQCRQKYVDEINSLTAKAKQAEQKLRISEAISASKQIKLDNLSAKLTNLCKRLNFKESDDIDEKLNNHIKSYNNAIADHYDYVEALSKAFDKTQDAEDEVKTLRKDNSILAKQVDKAEMEVLSLEDKIDALQFNEQKLTSDFQTIINRKDEVINERTKTAAYYQNAFLDLDMRVRKVLQYLDTVSISNFTQKSLSELLGWSESKISQIMNRHN